jgi:hypothetical protein
MARSSKKIKFVENVLVEFRNDEEAYAINTLTASIFQFSGLAMQIVKFISDTGDAGAEMLKLTSSFSNDPAVPSILAELVRVGVLQKIAGLRGAKRRSGAFPRSSLVLGTIAVGAGVLLPSAQAANCGGQPLSCTARGGTCLPAVKCFAPPLFTPFDCTYPPGQWICRLTPFKNTYCTFSGVAHQSICS